MACVGDNILLPLLLTAANASCGCSSRERERERMGLTKAGKNHLADLQPFGILFYGRPFTAH